MCVSYEVIEIQSERTNISGSITCIPIRCALINPGSKAAIFVVSGNMLCFLKKYHEAVDSPCTGSFHMLIIPSIVQ